MKFTLPVLVFAGMLGAIATPAVPVFAADAEIFDIEPNLRARIARERANQRRDERRSFGAVNEAGGGAADCGSVNIGNADQNDNSARSRLSQRQQTVIVTGPVINTARCR